MTTTPKVSVIVICYNHERFIERALDSIVCQVTDFNFEVLVFDDNSTDATSQIVSSYASKYPFIHLEAASSRQGPFGNGMRAMGKTAGKYVAFLDGDDEWAYEGKLQQMVTFLENNADYNGCFHDARIVNLIVGGHVNQLHQGFKRYSQMYKYNEDYHPWDALERKIIAQSSMMIRAELLKALVLNKMEGFKFSGGWMLSILLLRESKFKYFNEEWSIYNDHATGYTKEKNYLHFCFDNIIFLKRLLTDHYYENLKKDVYKSLVQEYSHVLYSPLLKTQSKWNRLKVLFQFSRYRCLWYWQEIWFHANRLF